MLSEIKPSSVNTIRVLSMIRPSGKVKIYSRILRMGTNGAKVDNASSGGGGLLVVLVVKVNWISAPIQQEAINIMSIQILKLSLVR